MLGGLTIFEMSAKEVLTSHSIILIREPMPVFQAPRSSILVSRVLNETCPVCTCRTCLLSLILRGAAPARPLLAAIVLTPGQRTTESQN